jgi:hypothetical protein
LMHMFPKQLPGVVNALRHQLILCMHVSCMHAALSGADHLRIMCRMLSVLTTVVMPSRLACKPQVQHTAAGSSVQKGRVRVGPSLSVKSPCLSPLGRNIKSKAPDQVLVRHCNVACPRTRMILVTHQEALLYAHRCLTAAACLFCLQALL